MPILAVRLPSNGFVVQNPHDLSAFEQLDDRTRTALIERLQRQFTEIAAIGMSDIGREEEKHGQCLPLAGPRGKIEVRMTRSAMKDLLCFESEFQTAITATLHVLRAGEFTGNSVTQLPRQDALLMRHGFIRWVFRYDQKAKRIVVDGISPSWRNPLRTVWRYFDEEKAGKLLRSGKLYLCRLDILEDKFEATPTRAMFEDHTRALKAVLGRASAHHLNSFENAKAAIYVSCWQASDYESLAMWKGYCPHDDGFALQTTERQLRHQHAAIQKLNPPFHLKEVRYVNHESDSGFLRDIVDLAFLKATWFSEEREMRFAKNLPHWAAGDEKQTAKALAKLPKGKRVPFDLDAAAVSIVLNPFASGEKNRKMRGMIHSHCRSLEERIKLSALTAKPMQVSDSHRSLPKKKTRL